MKERATLPGHFRRVVALAFSPDGKELAIATGGDGAQQGDVKLWDVSAGTEITFPGGAGQQSGK